MNTLRKTAARLVGLLTALLLPCSVQAALIDFEAYAHLQNIHGLNLGGVTATHSGTEVLVIDDDFGAHYRSPTKSVGVIPLTDEFNPLIFTFDATVNFVSLWGGDDGGVDLDSWTLNAYDSAVGGNLLDSQSSIVWSGIPYEQLIVAAPGIVRVEAFWTGPGCCAVAFDDLEFSNVAVPIPNTLALAMLGLVILRTRRTG